ncbi:hypothetical protein GYMLUDRAFT_37925 [Collybiopsis luxurians FD-317 M1]|nr:hypothetical protein GYMLUDRAFT_37925 [Collybiopsis luxurians FD-317 M1]
MADQIIAFNYDNYEWTEGKSNKGLHVRVGVLKTEKSVEGVDTIGEATVAETGTESNFSIQANEPLAVHWPVGDATWKETSKEVRDKKKLTRYSLFQNPPGSAFDYTLAITNTGGWGFVFWDADGDLHTLSTIYNGDHSYQYNSPNPTIVQVQ